MANDITILSCPQCGFPKIRDCGNGLYQCDDCGTHFDKSENIVLTEQEYLQTCNTEQLAEFLCEVWCGIDEVINIMSEDGEINKKDAIVKWLKQPHTPKE